MDDYISRQAAIDALNVYFDRIGKLKRRGLNKGEKAISLDTVGAIKTLPPAEPKRGKWERHYCNDGNPDGWQCDKCKEWYYFGQTLPNFCPNCGAKMEGADDE